jgi:hypothetical protein
MPWRKDSILKASDYATKLRYVARWLPGAITPIGAVIDAFVQKAEEYERAEHQTRLTRAAER